MTKMKGSKKVRPSAAHKAGSCSADMPLSDWQFSAKARKQPRSSSKLPALKKTGTPSPKREKSTKAVPVLAVKTRATKAKARRRGGR